MAKFYINVDQVTEERFNRDNNDNFNASIQSFITVSGDGDIYMTYNEED